MSAPTTAAGDLRQRLASGERVTALFLKLGDRDALACAAMSGADVLIADLEHSQLSEAEVRLACRLASALGVPLVVRVPSVDAGQVNRLLEAGACGIQLSTVVRAEQVRALVAAANYPPRGMRSFSLGHAQAGYGSQAREDYLRAQAAGPLLVAQVETATTEDALESIVAAGADVIFIGSEDVAISCAAAGVDPTARIADIAAAVTGLGVPLGIFAASEPAMTDAVRLGARYVAVGSDLALLRAALLNHIGDAVAVLTGTRSEAST